MRRRKLLVAVGLAVLVAVGVFVLWPRPNRITRENFDRIKEGLNSTEVEAILGPPGDYTTGPLQHVPWHGLSIFSGEPPPIDDYVLSSRWYDGDEVVQWRSDNAIFYVYFGSSGRVHTKCLSYVGRIDQSPLDNLLWRAKRLWRRIWTGAPF
jgi:hypothetical protein